MRAFYVPGHATVGTTRRRASTAHAIVVGRRGPVATERVEARHGAFRDHLLR